MAEAGQMSPDSVYSKHLAGQITKRVARIDAEATELRRLIAEAREGRANFEKRCRELGL